MLNGDLILERMLSIGLRWRFVLNSSFNIPRNGRF